ncbi:MAG: hypothetical protein O3C65_15335 [Proteobacteria bacterium]|nr:hypothetical protein [Pseudomonadota bacterium]MDA1060048.1 hypothetical protein [Pseudomonadota bacterium]
MPTDKMIATLRAAGLTIPENEMDTLAEGVAILDQVIARLDDTSLGEPTKKSGKTDER